MSRSDVEMSGIVLGIVVQNRHAYRQASGRVSRKISCSVHSEVAWWPILCVLVTSTIADIATMAAKAATSSHISFHHNFIIIYEYICTIIYICIYHFSYGCKFVYLKGTETVSGLPQASLHITMNDVLNCRSSELRNKSRRFGDSLRGQSG